MKYLYLLLFFGLMSVSYGQQVIGSFPSMDGGLEGETVGTAGVPTVTSIASGGTAEATWTKSSGTATIQTSIARTGTKSINWVMTSTSATASRMVTPTTTSGAITNTTGYMVQFYYHSAAAPAGTWSIGISPDGTNNVGSYVTTSTLVSTGTSWTKYTVAVTSGKSAGVSNLLGLSIIRVASGASPGLDIDDFCMYPGTTADVTAPTAPTTPVFSTVTPSAQTLSWTAGTDAGSGVAGYLVVRSATGDPTAALNVNGIYTTGTVLTGDQKIIYQGTAATCTDIGLSSSTPYYYRIYTVDKAFNYSTALTASNTTSAPLTYTYVSGNPTVVTNWSPNPPDFVSSGEYFLFSGTGSATLPSANWVVSGAGSKVIVGDGTHAFTFTVPSGFSYTGVVDVAAASTLAIANTTAYPTLGTLSAGSTVNYSGSGATQTIQTPTVSTSYSNLTNSNTTGLIAPATLFISGNFVNNGVFTNNSGNVTFNGSAPQTVSGSTGITFNTITLNNTGTVTPPNPLKVGNVFSSWTAGTVDMGTYNDVVEFTVPTFATAGVTNAIALTRGVIKLSTTCSLTQAYIGAVADSNSGVWLNNAGAVINASAQNYNANGLFRITNGSATVGTSTTHSFIATNNNYTGNWTIIEGGTLSTSGPCRVGGSSNMVGNFIMTGGTINAVTVGNAGSATPGFGSTSTGYMFMSGGNINMVVPNSTSTEANKRDFSVTSAANFRYAGGTVHFGTDATPTNGYFYAQGNLPTTSLEYTATGGHSVICNSPAFYGGVVVNSGCTLNGTGGNINIYGNLTLQGTNSSVFLGGNNLLLMGSATVGATDTINLYGSTFYVYGVKSGAAGSVTNSGTIWSTQAANQGYIRFSSDSNSTQSSYTALGSGVCGTVAKPCSLTVDNTNGLLITNSTGGAVTNAIVANRVTMYKGTASMSSSNDIEVALGSAATAYVYLGNVNYETLGGFSMTPYYNVTPDNLFIGYSNTNQNVQVGAQNEIPADRTLIKYLYINNQLGVSLSSYSGDMTCALSMQRGTFSLGNYNLTLPTASTPSANDSSYVIANGTGKFNVIVTSGSSVTVPLGCLASIAPKCTTVTSSPTVTMSSTTGLVAGMKVVGGGIPANTYLSVINSSTQVTLSQNVTTGYTGLYIYFSDYMPIVVKNSLATQTYAFGINAITPPSNGLARQWYMKETNPGGTSFTSISANWNVCDLGNLPASGTFDFVCNTSGSNSQYDVLQPGNTILTAATFGNDSLKVSTFAKQPGDISGGLYLSLVQSDAALPVELSAFTSNINGRTVQLNWETKTEKNSNRFDIERSVSGSAWETIGSVRASVLSNSPKQYSYTVNNLQVGTYQFRLKMVDNDGTFEYGSTIQSEIALPKNYELNQNYPNPFNPSTKLSYSLPNDSKVILDIYSISGEKVGQLVNDNQAAGYYTIDFGSTTMHKNLSSGVYFYRLNAVDKSGKNFTSIKKMVLLK